MNWYTLKVIVFFSSCVTLVVRETTLKLMRENHRLSKHIKKFIFYHFSHKKIVAALVHSQPGKFGQIR